jgi:hypothetical protein
MPRLRTDDGPRKLRAVWLGPAGHTLAFQWTYVQWLVTLLTVPVTATLGALLLRLLGADWVWTAGIGVLWGGAAGLWLAVRLMRNVTFDEPLRYQRRLVRGEFSSRSSRVVESRPLSVEFASPPVGYLAPSVRRAMGWDVPEQQPLPSARPVTPVSTVPASSADDSDTAPHPSGPSPATPGPATAANPYLAVFARLRSALAASRKAPDGPQDDL